MLARVVTFALVGVDALPVTVEADIHPGLPSFTIVGLPDAAVQESRERVRAALVNSGGNPAAAPCVHLVFNSDQGPATSIVLVNPSVLPRPPNGSSASSAGKGVDLVSVIPGSGMLAADLAAPGVTGGSGASRTVNTSGGP